MPVNFTCKYKYVYANYKINNYFEFLIRHRNGRNIIIMTNYICDECKIMADLHNLWYLKYKKYDENEKKKTI